MNDEVKARTIETLGKIRAMAKTQGARIEEAVEEAASELAMMQNLARDALARLNRRTRPSERRIRTADLPVRAQNKTERERAQRRRRWVDAQR